MLIVGLALFCVGILSIRYFLKHVPNIRIDNTGISIGPEFFHWSDIHKARYNQEVEGMDLLSELDATYLDLYDGSSRFFLDKMYLDSLTMKYHIQQKSRGWEPCFIPRPRYNKVPKLLEKRMKIYRRKQQLNLSNIIVWGTLFGLLLYIQHAMPPLDTLPFYAVGWVVVFLVSSIGLNYVKLSSNFLVIRHVFWFWKKHVFKLKDIEKIIIGENLRREHRLRIITKDLKTRTYFVSTLSRSTARSLITHLQSLGIIVEERTRYILTLQ